MSKKVRCTPTSSLGELLARMCIRCMAIPTPHIISIIWLSPPMIVLIDVILSHLYVFLLHLLSLFPFRCQLSCSRSSITWVLKISKGVDPFDLYLASGLGTSPDKTSKDTKCETLVDLVLNNKKFSISYSQSPFLHANTIWRHSSHGQQELLHPMFFCFLCQC